MRYLYLLADRRGLGDAEDKPMPTRVRGLRILSSNNLAY
jgi:hypothetical protein